MREWPYAKEPFDTRLFVLLFIKKLWLVISVSLLGALLLGGGYFLKKVVFGGPVEYEITTNYYIEYANMNPETGELHNYINDATWKEWVVSDWFVDRAWQFAIRESQIESKYNIKKEDLKTFFFGDLPSDIRIPISKVTTPYQELTIVLNQALQKTYFVFADEHEEMASIQIINETPLQEADKDVRLVRAVILGAILGGFAGSLVTALYIIWDDTIVLPEILGYRYNLPAVGYLGKDETILDESTVTNVKYLFEKGTSNALLVMGKHAVGEVLPECLKESFSQVYLIDKLDGDCYERLRNAEGILLAVEAGSYHGKAIEHDLEELKLQNCSVKGAFLYGADRKLIKCYRFGQKQK